MLITITPSTAKLVGSYDHSKLDKELSYMAPGYQFSDAYRRNRWDGRVRLLTRRGEFPVGLVARVAEWFEDQGVEVEVDNRLPRPARPALGSVYTSVLRGYQKEAVDSAIDNVRGILQLATGAGKTNIAAALFEAIDRPGIFLVHTKDLMYQAYERFCELIGKDQVGMLGDGKYLPGRILVATMQSTCSILGVSYGTADDEGSVSDRAPVNNLGATITTMRPTIKEKEVVIIDECQHAACETMLTIVKDLRSACYVWGLSATPWRDDGKDLEMEGVLGKVIFQVSATDLIEQGFLMKPTIRCLPIERAEDLEPDCDYATLYRDQVVENVDRNRFIANLCVQNKKAGRRLQLIIVKQLKHVDILLKTLRPKRLIVATLTGKETGEVRAERLRLAAQGTIEVLVATTVADEGLDLPMLDTVIMAGGGKATARALQRVGRIVRPFDGKLPPVAYDLMDATFPAQNVARISAYKTESGYEVEQL